MEKRRREYLLLEGVLASEDWSFFFFHRVMRVTGEHEFRVANELDWKYKC